MRVNIILLASGSGSRFDGNKLAWYIGGWPMYMHVVLQTMRLTVMPEGCEVQDIVLVTKYTELAQAVSGYGLHAIRNEDSHLGISASVRLGIAGSREADAYMFCVCDQPFLKAETMAGLIRTYKERRSGIVCTSWAGQPGNPCLFSSVYKEELLALTGDMGGRRIIRAHPEDIALYDLISPDEIRDIDRREQLEGV